MTPQQKRAYLKHPSHCPYCHSDQYEGWSMTFDTGTIEQKITCSSCSRHWFDVYRLVDVVEPEDDPRQPKMF